MRNRRRMIRWAVSRKFGGKETPILDGKTRSSSSSPLIHVIRLNFYFLNCTKGFILLNLKNLQVLTGSKKKLKSSLQYSIKKRTDQHIVVPITERWYYSPANDKRTSTLRSLPDNWQLCTMAARIHITLTSRKNLIRTLLTQFQY